MATICAHRAPFAAAKPQAPDGGPRPPPPSAVGSPRWIRRSYCSLVARWWSAAERRSRKGEEEERPYLSAIGKAADPDGGAFQENGLLDPTLLAIGRTQNLGDDSVGEQRTEEPAGVLEELETNGSCILMPCEAPLVLPLGGYTYGEKSLFIVNDWHASLVAVTPGTEFISVVVHSPVSFLILVFDALYWKGVEPATTFEYLGLPPQWYGALEWIFPTWARKHALDKGEAVNLLKGAIVTADRIVTVSQVICYLVLCPTIWITNGIDTNEWNPTSDKHISFHYSVDDLSEKIGFIGRLDYQKGIDVIRSALHELLQDDIQFVRDPETEDWMRWVESTNREKFRGWVGFNLKMDSCDILLMPSRYEPCGLNQLYAMRYGTVPVVNCTGGLRVR
ncbi:hypothetical protein GW17_00033770 [Ensete ventricosum]|nr:hypothetical protein GW17_00033770 [Ensete ventricosum]